MKSMVSIQQDKYNVCRDSDSSNRLVTDLTIITTIFESFSVFIVVYLLCMLADVI